MKNISNKIFGFGLAVLFVPALTGCMEEIEPTTIVTAEQAAESPTASEALQMAMPAYLNRYTDANGWHYSFGYPAQMMIRNILGGDTGFNVSTYASHFAYWGMNQYQGADYVFAGYIWSYYYGFLLAVNNMVGAVDPENANEAQLGALGTGLAYRALIYLDLARMYEFLPNDINSNGINADGNNVMGLTVPIVTDKTEVSIARNNPRATHEEMYNFILEDLDNAEKYIVYQETTSGQVLPDLSCVYGLKARLYMWNEDYANAQKYARLAIDNAKVGVMSKERALDTKNGMNTASDFMWAAQTTSEDDVVQTGIVNWPSWASNQTDFGYTGPSTEMFLICDANFYNRISNTDWRKLWFQAPEGSPLRDQIQYMNADYAAVTVPYAALKFHPAQGNISDYSVGAAAAVPVMRVEEMYFIEAEAAAQQNPSAGMELLKNFMTAYRDPNYASKAADKAAAIDEITFQKQVELWGEGQRFFDIKRLNIPVTRGYKDTPFYSQFRLNTTTRPAWTNLVISRNEVMNNNALQGFNNPDPSDAYTPWTE
ncbi:MAG: RagB/SusD family nutrient uptake outer membrane protein [Bacteroidaceae bacterium]|nr:RagB/SusD family nutrient uptake outer membrane protein [Bacteroidaceae bacterium]